MDLSQYSRRDLMKLRDQVSRELESRRQEEKQKARQEIRSVAAKYGFAVGDLVSGGGAAARRNRIRYQHPEDAAKTWTGRGRKPNWIKDWEASGRSLDQLRRH